MRRIDMVNVPSPAAPDIRVRTQVFSGGTINGGTIEDLEKDGIRFEYRPLDLSEIVVEEGDQYRQNLTPGSKHNVMNTKVTLDGDTLATSERFWTSLASKVGISTNIFNLYSHKEVFDRIVRRAAFSRSGHAVAVRDVKNNKLLAITSPDKNILTYPSLKEVLKRNEGKNLRYHDGVISSFHNMPVDTPLVISGEQFAPRIYLETPVDGWGDPRAYLALLRYVCSNGMVGFSKAFKSICKLGTDDPRYSLNRMFDSYSNDEGLDVLSRRLSIANETWMSIDEAHMFMHVIEGWIDHKDNVFADPIRDAMKSLFGDLQGMFGISNLSEMNKRQRSMLPTQATIGEAINFATEIATHHTNRGSERDGGFTRKIQAEIGNLISKPSGYDLEGTADEADKSYMTEKLKNRPALYVGVMN